MKQNGMLYAIVVELYDGCLSHAEVQQLVRAQIITLGNKCIVFPVDCVKELHFP